MANAHENQVKTENQKKQILKKATKAYAKFLEALEFNWKEDPNMENTPFRVAKMYLYEIANGRFSEPPKITTFDNLTGYEGMVFQGNIDVKSFCSHHMMPIIGKAHVAYIPNMDYAKRTKIIGLSKLNRIVEYFSRRPQVQENLTQQIHDYLDEILPNNGGIAVSVEALHTCVSHRGINQNSTMKTTVLSGSFKNNETKAREEFFNYIKSL